MDSINPETKSRLYLRSARVARRFAPEEMEELLEKAYRAEFAQAYVRYAEQDFQTRNSVWTTQWDRRTASARD